MVSQSITPPVPAGGDARLGGMVEAALAGARALAAADRTRIAVKPDGTPQTVADLASDSAIRAVLAEALPGIPVVSEESLGALSDDFADRPFLLVDPLDGTREFMAGHADHAVCIALIENRRPRLGVIVAPAMRRMWTADAEAIEVKLDAALAPIGQGSRIGVAAMRSAVRHVVTSRSRPDPFAAAVARVVPQANLRPVGAVLKLVAVATGEACLFPAGNPSSEWDIAAGEALVLAAGGSMLSVDGAPLLYGQAADGFRHRPYAAGANEEMVRLAIAQWPAS